MIWTGVDQRDGLARVKCHVMNLAWRSWVEHAVNWVLNELGELANAELSAEFLDGASNELSQTPGYELCCTEHREKWKRLGLAELTSFGIKH